MDSQEESSTTTQGSSGFDSEYQTNFSLPQSQIPKTEDSVTNLQVEISRPVLKHQLDCLIEEDEDVDYSSPRLITGLPEPINVDDRINKLKSENPEITSPRAPCLLFTTEEIKDYIDHLETKSKMLYENMEETNRYLREVLQEQTDDKRKIKNQQRLLNEQEEELIFYRKFFKTSKNYANEPISEEYKKIKTPPKTDFFKYSFGRKLNIEMHPIDVDPDIKDAVDQRVRYVLQAQADKEILSPSLDCQNILYINHPTEESNDDDFHSTKTPCPEPLVYDVPLEFQHTPSTLHQYNPLGSPGSSTTGSSPSPIQDTFIVHLDSEAFEEPAIYEVPLQFRNKEMANDTKKDVTSGCRDIFLTEMTGHPFSNVQEAIDINEAESVNSSTSPSPTREVDEDIRMIKLSEEIVELPEAGYMEKRECEPTTDSLQDAVSITNLMASIKGLSTEITRETARQDVKDQVNNESLTEKERRIIEEIEKYVGMDDNISDPSIGSTVLGKVPYVSISDIENFQLNQKLDLVYVKCRDPVTNKEMRASGSRGSKKKVKEIPIKMEKRRYPLQPVYRSNTQKTILPPIIRPNNKTHKPQSKFTVQEKLTGLPPPDFTIGKRCTLKKPEPVLYDDYNLIIQSDESHYGLKSKPVNPADYLPLQKLPTVHTKPIIRDNKHRTDNGLSLPQIKSASTKPNLRNQIKTTILPDILKPGHTTSQYTDSTLSAARHFTKSANYKPPKVLLPVPPRIYQSNRRKEKQPHKLPHICHLGLSDVFPSRKD